MRMIVELCVGFVQLCLLFVVVTKVFGNIFEIFSMVAVGGFFIGIVLGLKN